MREFDDDKIIVKLLANTKGNNLHQTVKRITDIAIRMEKSKIDVHVFQSKRLKDAEKVIELYLKANRHNLDLHWKQLNDYIDEYSRKWR